MAASPELKNRVRVAAGRQGAPMPVVRAAEPMPVSADGLGELMMRLANDKDGSVERARAVFDFYKDVRAHEALLAFNAAFFALRRLLPTINKDGKIEHADTKGDGKPRQKSRYATYENVMGVLEPLNRDHGFCLGSWLEPGEAGRLNIVTQLDHELGHFRKSMFPGVAETSGAKNAMQAWGSSESFGLRYNLIALYQIVSKAPGDRDVDGNAGQFRQARDGGLVEAGDAPPISGAQLAELKIVMEDCGVTEKAICGQYGLAKLEDLQADLFEATKARCRTYKAARAERRGG